MLHSESGFVAALICLVIGGEINEGARIKHFDLV